MVEERATGSGICIYNASFFFRLGFFWDRLSDYIFSRYTCHLHICYLNLMAGRIRPGWGQGSNTGMIKNCQCQVRGVVSRHRVIILGV